MKKIATTALLAVLTFGYCYCQEYTYNTEDSQSDYICEGTKWVMKVMSWMPPLNVEIHTYNEWIEGTVIVNDKEYMQVWQDKHDDPDKHYLLGYIRKEEDQIYFIDKSSLPNDDNTEYLLIDFSLNPGEQMAITSKGPGDSNPNYPITAICTDIGEETNQGHSYETRTIEFLIDGQSYPEYFPPIKWIKGIGSQGGVVDNIYFGESGGASVYEVYHNDELVYKYQNSSIDIIEENAIDSMAPTLKYHPDGRVFNDGETGIYIEKGKKTIKR